MNSKIRLECWLAVIVILSSVLYACTSRASIEKESGIDSATQPYPMSSDMTPQAIELPEYLKSVWPSPEEVVSIQSYNDSLMIQSPHSRGIGVELWADKVNEHVDEEEKTIIQRSSLIVDGNNLSEETLRIADGLIRKNIYDDQGNLLYTIDVGPYYLSWGPVLGLGIHEAKFTVMKNSGEMLEYAWRFTIVDK